ncbi:MAG TPA: Uma2 family endonuclease [Pseudonocardiaceae bacterium]|nr:Uma2 family endonuclease [Pseudonocardiaceae bacterium]
MSVLPWPDHLVTFDEWELLPEDSRFGVEVVEGVLIVWPRPVTFHQRAVSKLGYWLEEQLPKQLSALSEVEVVITAGPLPTVRIPDVVVVDTQLADTNPARYKPKDVSLAVEILSNGSVGTDRVTKFHEYADAGIANYWIIDLDAPVSLLRYHLIDGDYELFGEHTGKVSVELDGSPITLDLDALVTRRP